jgi:hypothetical protein
LTTTSKTLTTTTPQPFLLRTTTCTAAVGIARPLHLSCFVFCLSSNLHYIALNTRLISIAVSTARHDVHGSCRYRTFIMLMSLMCILHATCRHIFLHRTHVCFHLFCARM